MKVVPEGADVERFKPDREIDGYVLFKFQDIIGYDIEYVEYRDQTYCSILEAFESNELAIAFNYNWYIKGIGRELQPVSGDSSWLKKGVEPWVCVKVAYVDSVS